MQIPSPLSPLPKSPLDIPRPHALNYRSCSRKHKQALSTPYSPDTPPTSYARPPDGIDRVFDNLLDIARGNDPTANGYDMLRATRILYDRGFGKVTRNRPQMPTPQSEKSNNHTNHSSDIPAPKTAAASIRPAAKLEQKLDDTLGPPQAPDKPNPSHPERSAAEACPEPVEACPEHSRRGSKDTPPIRLDEPGHIPAAPGYTPDLVREAQYYVLEITNYGAELAKILAYIHEPDPEDTTIRACHRITAGLMILDRVLGNL